MPLKHLARRFELKGLDEKGMFSGYGSVFGVEDWYQDIVAPGAFARSLAERGLPKMLWQHDSTRPCGVWTKAAEDAKGLFLEGKLSLGATDGRDAYALLKDGALDGLSIGFVTRRAEYDEEKETRTLLDVDLWEVSPVTFPANEEALIDAVKAMTHSDVAAAATQIGKMHGLCKSCEGSDCQGEMMKGLDALSVCLGGSTDGKATPDPKNIRLLEMVLREAGLSREEAKAVLARGFKAALGPRDADELADMAQEIRKFTQEIRGN